MHMPFSYKQLSILLLTITYLILTTPQISYAANILTKEKINAFYKQFSEVQMLGKSVTLQFLEEHMHKNSQTTLHMITNMAGIEPQKNTEIYDKKRLIKETAKGYEMGEIETIEHNILLINIAPDGLSAKVKDSSFSIFNMTLSTPQGKIKLHNEQSMLCDGSIILTSDNIIKTNGGVCNVEVNIKPAQ